MSLKSILKEKCVHACDRSASIMDVVELMKREDVGSIVVNENDEPVGIITDRDLVLRAMSEGADFVDFQAGDVMSSPVETIDENSGIYDVIERMHDKGIRRLCVTDSNGQCTNVVSSGDILELWAKEMAKLAEATVPQEEKLVKRAS